MGRPLSCDLRDRALAAVASAVHYSGGIAGVAGGARGERRGFDVVAVLRPARDHVQKKTRHAAEQDVPTS